MGSFIGRMRRFYIGLQIESLEKHSLCLHQNMSKSLTKDIIFFVVETAILKALGLPLSTSAHGGGCPKAEIIQKLSKGGCVDLRTRGKGSKKS